MTVSTAFAALIGTLAGTVVGGLISLAAVNRTIEAQQESDLRAERQQAYSAFFTDAVRHLQLIHVRLADDGSIDTAEAAELEQNNLAVTRSYAAAVLVATRDVGDALERFNTEANTYGEAVAEGQGDAADPLDTALNAFWEAARIDLGASDEPE